MGKRANEGHGADDSYCRICIYALIVSHTEGSGLCPFSRVTRDALRELGELLQGEDSRGKRIHGVPQKWDLPELILSIWHALRRRLGASAKGETRAESAGFHEK